jgi:hypothetical protein
MLRFHRFSVVCITEPTEGYAETCPEPFDYAQGKLCRRIRGQDGSLLEVGTGFRRELTLRLRSGRGRTSTFRFAQGQALNGAMCDFGLRIGGAAEQKPQLCACDWPLLWWPI